VDNSSPGSALRAYPHQLFELSQLTYRPGYRTRSRVATDCTLRTSEQSSQRSGGYLLFVGHVDLVQLAHKVINHRSPPVSPSGVIPCTHHVETRSSPLIL
jgi:hypothetical protein